MIHTLDRLWFRALGKVHCWTVLQGQAHCQRETLRRFHRIMAGQKPHLN